MISLFIDNEVIQGLNIDHVGDAGFQVYQNQLEFSTSCIYINNVIFTDNCGERVGFYVELNADENYPLLMTYKDNDYYPIDEEGTYQLDKNLFLGAG